MEYLDEALLKYSRSGVYPFHMPGHKRRGIPFADASGESSFKAQEVSSLEELTRMDITEIDGFDNLHHAVGILREAQQRAADLYGAEESFYLVNGSTCGILAAICASAPKKSRVLMARNCHKAVYHAVFLQELTAEYLYPVVTKEQLLGQITPQQVEEALKGSAGDVAAIIITSPTYEGILSDVAQIAEVAHRYGVPLIVDAAHGAHLGFGGGFAESPVKQGADAVIMSLHKTLPSFTQTALLHLCSERIDAGQIKKYLSIFETSSPSYVFMAGMDACIRMLQKERHRRFSRYRELLDGFYQKTGGLKQLHVMIREDLSAGEAYGWDDSKIVILSRHPVYGGAWLHQRLLEQYRLQAEMVSAHYVLLMTSIMDEPEGFGRLAAALEELDGWLVKNKAAEVEETPFTVAGLYQENKRAMQIYEVEDKNTEQINLAEAAGRVSADTIYLYPPGIPVLVPGEIITGEFIRGIHLCQKRGLLVEGSEMIGEDRINVVCL